MTDPHHTDQPTRGPAADAELALALEVTGTPKPGNVDRHRDFPDLRFEQFAAGAVGARVGLERAAGDAPVGEAFEASVAGMSRQTGGNTQFGCLLLLVPLVAATAGRRDAALVDERTAVVRGESDADRSAAGRRSPDGDRPSADAGGTADRSAGVRTETVTDHDEKRAGSRPAGGIDRDRVREVCCETTIADAAAFYRSFEYVDVAVADPPEEMAELDVRRGADAIETIRERELTLWDVMERSAPHDANAREWTRGFPRTFRAARAIWTDDGPVPDRIARAFLQLLAEEPDTLIRTEHGDRVAARVQRRAREINGSSHPLDAAESWADELVEAGVNPGTTADITAAATYVALRRGVQP